VDTQPSVYSQLSGVMFRGVLISRLVITHTHKISITEQSKLSRSSKTPFLVNPVTDSIVLIDFIFRFTRVWVKEDEEG
jgi:hypothetical protein